MQRYRSIISENVRFFFLIYQLGVIPLSGARDAKQAEENAGALGWRLTNEEITELENHQLNPKNIFLLRFWQHG